MGFPVEIVERGVDWPAWVQAIGSVVAILAAIAIAQWQANRAREDRFAEQREFRLAVAALARRVADLALKDAQDMRTNAAYYHYEGLSTWEYDMLDRALERFDPSRLGSADGVLAMEKLRNVGRNAAGWAAAVAEDYRGDAYHEDLDANLTAWAVGVNETAVTLEALAKKPV